MEPNAVLHRFFLEFNLGYPDGTAYNFEFRMKNVTVYFESKKYTSRLQFGETETNWKSEGYQSFSYSLDGDDTPYQANYVSKDDAFSIGYIRRRIGTIVMIGFSTTDLSNDQKEFARDCLDHFLNVYRLFTLFGNAENNSKLMSTIEEVLNGVFTEKKFQVRERQSYSFSQLEPTLDLHSKFCIGEIECQKIGNRLTNEDDLEVYERVICEGKRLLLSDGNFCYVDSSSRDRARSVRPKKIKELC